MRCCLYDDGLYTKDLTEVFWYPPQTEEVHLPDTLKVIHTSTFEYCNFTEIDIPYGIVELETYTFYGVYLERVSLPNSLKYIRNNAFCCKSLTDVAIPYSVEKVENRSFNGVNLKKVLFSVDTDIDIRSQNIDWKNPPVRYKAHSQEEWDELYEQHFK